VRHENVTSPPSTLSGPLNIASVDSGSAPIALATSSDEDLRGVIPRHEFLAEGPELDPREGTISIKSPTAAEPQSRITCFFADMKIILNVDA